MKASISWVLGRRGMISSVCAGLVLGVGGFSCGGGSSSDMVSVPAATYAIGRDDGSEAEGPLHEVFLDAFEIDVHEVTNSEFARFTRSEDCPGPLYERNPDPCVYDGAVQSNTREDYWDNEEYADYPVLNVRWDQAEAFCRWAGKRLPTEAEWEAAARGSDARLYPWGGDEPTCELANYQGCTPDSVAVESMADGVTSFGAFDMSGNVAEWVADFYNPDTYQWDSDTNPTGPDNGSQRVVRGGSWFCGAGKVTVTYRDHADPLLQYNTIGFRCARSASASDGSE